ncbi:hypothetical protein ACFOVU_08775 [Nocardiopsis sediminis]|uniref:Uncharacterized protein n=1 Tax=Nocardiopsis sediminis TaxID=1778267 RepID=A0ABV8FIP3_9ACTN
MSSDQSAPDLLRPEVADDQAPPRGRGGLTAVTALFAVAALALSADEHVPMSEGPTNR